VQRNESRLRAVYESNNDAIMLLSEKCFVDCNSATLAIFKCPAKSEFCGKHPSQISPEYQPNGRLSSEAATDHIMTALTRGYDRFEWQHSRWDGSEFIAEVQLCRMEIDDQAILQAIVRDISDRKAVEAAIRQKSEELEQALWQLQKTQLQLVQIEKMSVLGNLVAGVAHEINNPIGCIVGNVSVMQNYVTDLIETLDLYQANFPEPGITIEQQLDAIDLDYLRQDVPDVMQAIKDSGDRIAAISQSLRTFSRTDGIEKQLFNVHDGLDSTVLILRHRLKANEQRPKIEVVTHYGQLPEINCFPGQLNQVFMNILANAIDAIDELSEGKSFQELAQSPHQITISTRAIESRIQIMIADDGPGMPPEVQRRIFDYMFTTKEVGRGTGLGLAIAHQIVVETHGGAIDLQSQVGEGSTFTLTLPC
jgi:PAS domain S-box-containing protein